MRMEYSKWEEGFYRVQAGWGIWYDVVRIYLNYYHEINPDTMFLTHLEILAGKSKQIQGQVLDACEVGLDKLTCY